MAYISINTSLTAEDSNTLLINSSNSSVTIFVLLLLYNVLFIIHLISWHTLQLQSLVLKCVGACSTEGCCVYVRCCARECQTPTVTGERGQLAFIPGGFASEDFCGTDLAPAMGQRTVSHIYF